MSISVIICTYGMERFSDVLEAVDSIKSQTFKDHEIIVVIDDNKVLFNELKKSLSSDVGIVVSAEKGLSYARNTGIEKAKHEIVAFLDDDAVANKNWLDSILRNFNDPNVKVVGGRIEPLWIDGRPKWFPEELDWIVGCTYKGHPDERGLVRNVIGCNMAFKKDVFNTVGLFETSVGRVGAKLLAGEEMELCVRITRMIPNSKIIFDPEMIVFHKVHPYRQSVRYVNNRAYNEGISKAKISSQTNKGQGQNELNTESNYIQYLLFKAVPTRLKNMFKMKDFYGNLAKIVVIFSAIVMVGLGYSSKYRFK